ncbi:hypothetical protein LOTGIDRAFT_175580 [Lottia gigantea]|uniref:Uncharacterized protein n=1 Tax=Lottia gigantea TaxID=225164 RepID=V4AIC2_LOTGI|nr:hypothetical protein LOTGIDRAFT_175580 [Lottia gigantea]ESO93196.1 hypothetical protein LOTGIDRAFT_175580 [Lottia gigantea]
MNIKPDFVTCISKCDNLDYYIISTACPAIPIVKELYKELQQHFPDIFKKKLVIPFKQLLKFEVKVELPPFGLHSDRNSWYCENNLVDNLALFVSNLIRRFDLCTEIFRISREDNDWIRCPDN